MAYGGALLKKDRKDKKSGKLNNEDNIKAIAVVEMNKLKYRNLINLLLKLFKNEKYSQKIGGIRSGGTFIFYGKNIEDDFIYDYTTSFSYENYLEEIPETSKFSRVNKHERKVLQLPQDWHKAIDWVLKQ